MNRPATHPSPPLTLAHAIRNRAEAAYRRGDLLDKRRALMGDWAAYLDAGLEASSRGVPAPARAAG